jgi:tRNA A37 threonylcarbamoyladenosine synthetase subunit TsaC/SUA5/YrdC
MIIKAYSLLNFKSGPSHKPSIFMMNGDTKILLYIKDFWSSKKKLIKKLISFIFTKINFKI